MKILMLVMIIMTISTGCVSYRFNKGDAVGATVLAECRTHAADHRAPAGVTSVNAAAFEHNLAAACMDSRGYQKRTMSLSFAVVHAIKGVFAYLFTYKADF